MRAEAVAVVADWDCNSLFFSDLLPHRHPMLWSSLTAILKRAGVPVRLITGTRDIWARDFMPVQIWPQSFRQFIYAPDYLQGHESLITSGNVCQLSFMQDIQKSRIRLDGGNVVQARSKVVLTDKLFKENPQWTRRSLHERLEKDLQATCIFVPQEPHDTIGHADGMLRFLNEDTVVVNDYSKVNRQFRRQLHGVLRRHRLAVEELPYEPEDLVLHGIGSAVGAWINYLRVQQILVVPTFGLDQDEQACRQLETLIPGVDLVPQRCKDLAREGGVLNCIAYAAQIRRAGH